MPHQADLGAVAVSFPLSVIPGIIWTDEGVKNILREQVSVHLQMLMDLWITDAIEMRWSLCASSSKWKRLHFSSLVERRAPTGTFIA